MEFWNMFFVSSPSKSTLPDPSTQNGNVLYAFDIYLYLPQTTENSRILLTETAKKRLCLSFRNPILRTAVRKTCCLALLYCYISYDTIVFE